jgi:hypothetical protein
MAAATGAMQSRNWHQSTALTFLHGVQLCDGWSAVFAAVDSRACMEEAEAVLPLLAKPRQEMCFDPFVFAQAAAPKACSWWRSTRSAHNSTPVRLFTAGRGGALGCHRVPWGPKIEMLHYFLQKILVQTALQESAALVRKVIFYVFNSSVNKHTNKRY